MWVIKVKIVIIKVEILELHVFEYVKESNFKRFECILSKIYSVYTLELL